MISLFQRCLILVVVIAASTAALAAEPPNIILMMGDDHGWDEVAYNGHPHLHTPVLDEMAATGLRLDRFYSGHPSCSPTRGSFLTGRHPNRYGTFSPNWSMRPEEISIGHIMKQAGYRTGHFGKWHVGPVKLGSPTSPGAMGFDEWLSHDNFFELDPVLVRNGGAPRKYPGESSEVVIDETIAFIDRAKKSAQPFLAVVWFGSPHEPYMGLPEDLALYDDLPTEYAEQTVKLTSTETGQATTHPLRDVLRERYAEITAMDRAIGKLRDHLKSADLRENTFVLYCGDNGVPPSGDGATNPFRELKGSVYDGGIRVPGVIEWPAKITRPRTSGLPTVTSDLLPTLAGLTGQPLPDRPIDGESLVPLLTQDMPTREKPIFFWQYDNSNEPENHPEPYIDPALQEGTTPLIKMMDGKYTRTFRNQKHPVIHATDFSGSRAMVYDGYKLVVDGDDIAGTELFSLADDPTESVNLAARHPARTEAMRAKLHHWQFSVLHSLTGADYK